LHPHVVAPPQPEQLALARLDAGEQRERALVRGVVVEEPGDLLPRDLGVPAPERDVPEHLDGHRRRLALHRLPRRALGLVEVAPRQVERRELREQIRVVGLEREGPLEVRERRRLAARLRVERRARRQHGGARGVERERGLEVRLGLPPLAPSHQHARHRDVRLDQLRLPRERQPGLELGGVQPTRADERVREQRVCLRVLRLGRQEPPQQLDRSAGVAELQALTRLRGDEREVAIDEAHRSTTTASTGSSRRRLGPSTASAIVGRMPFRTWPPKCWCSAKLGACVTWST
jgi:hypothetical protein